MRKNAIYFLLFILASLTFGGCKTAKLSDALKKHALGEYYDAASIYRKVYAKTKPKKTVQRGMIAFNMGECYRLANNTAKAVSAYQNSLRYDYPDTTLVFRYAQMLHRAGRYPDAAKQYQAYLDSFPDYLLAKNGLEGCRLAVEWKANPSNYAVQRMDAFNSRRSDFCPMFLGTDNDLLYFTSSRDAVQGEKKSAITGQKNNDLFMVKKDENGKWQQPEPAEGSVNTEFDEGICGFSPDGSIMYYTFCEKDNSVAKTAEIRSSARSGASWAAGQRVAVTKDTFSVHAHPAMSPDGKFLYFVSDMPGGYGGKDIWRAAIGEANEYIYIENVGADINTPGDEMFPYFHADGTFYYSSNGLPGMGGLDLFAARYNVWLKRWEVENLKPPINSYSDDFGITFGTGGDFGFFSSNRNDGSGSDHIYAFSRPTYAVSLEGFVSTNEEVAIHNANVRMVGKDGSIERFISRVDGSYKASIKHAMDYVMMASAPGFLNKMKRLSTSNEQRDLLYYADFFLASLVKPVMIDNIFYDFDKATLRPESEEALDEVIVMLNDNPNVVIELSSHTDSKGSDEYNDKLSQRRAESVVNYLTGRGIEPERLSPMGYGETTPKTVTGQMAEIHDFVKEGDVLTEEFILTLTPEQQVIADQLNRRTEFKVLRTDFRLF